MNGTGEISLGASVNEVWIHLLDPDVLAKCVIGCDRLESTGESTYHADLSIGIAAVKGKYDATIALADVEELKGYRLIVHGEGPPGVVDAEGVIRLSVDGEHQTILSYEYTANVGGKIAAVGQRMLGGIAKLIINDFFKRMKKEIERTSRSA
ncbi:MAG TPA: carbon monoxide dehydrogenase subunit G [Alicyclobacillus sp.]|nr:carbon monoxide dehydrogenase subunit G [Alicyclobacillus sp.]